MSLAPFFWDLPLLLALGQVDSIQVAHSDICRDTVIPHETGRQNHATRSTLPTPTAIRCRRNSSISKSSSAVHPPQRRLRFGRGPDPVGYDRMYVHVDGDFAYEEWWQEFPRRAVVITNGPLMRHRLTANSPAMCSKPMQALRSISKSA